MNAAHIDAETADIERELFTQDAYHADTIFDEDQMWFDVGCHVGLFTRLALTNGAAVIGAVDIEPDMVRLYSENHNPIAVQGDIRTATDIIDALRRINGDVGIIFANALKLDIQGAETAIMTDPDEVAILAAQFDDILMEYHEPETIWTVIALLEKNGYDIQFMDAHTDSMSGQPTHILFATKN